MNIRSPIEELCSICFDSYEESSGHDVVRLDCQHAFGRKCIIHWALENNICPDCGLKTIPAEFSGRGSIFRRLANRTIFGLTPEQKFELLFGLCATLFTGSMVAGSYMVRPDSAIGNGVDSLLLSATCLTGCIAYFRATDRSLFLGAFIGYGLSALSIWIATTAVRSSQEAVRE